MCHISFSDCNMFRRNNEICLFFRISRITRARVALIFFHNPVWWCSGIDRKFTRQSRFNFQQLYLHWKNSRGGKLHRQPRIFNTFLCNNHLGLLPFYLWFIYSLRKITRSRRINQSLDSKVVYPSLVWISCGYRYYADS